MMLLIMVILTFYTATADDDGGNKVYKKRSIFLIAIIWFLALSSAQCIVSIYCFSKFHDFFVFIQDGATMSRSKRADAQQQPVQPQSPFGNFLYYYHLFRANSWSQPLFMQNKITCFCKRFGTPINSLESGRRNTMGRQLHFSIPRYHLHP